MIFPFIVILPGVLAIPLIPQLGHSTDPTYSYNNALPLMMAKYYPAGMLGLGLTALLASFMSGMAGNVTAFNTVFTYDLYSVYIARNKPDLHYLRVGRAMTVLGVLVSVATAYLAQTAPSVMDFTQTVFGFVNAPLLATFLFGMFWKRTSAWGGFFGLLTGIVAAATHWMMTEHHILQFSTDQAGNFWRACVAFGVAAIVTFVVSLVTAPPKSEQLEGLVYGHSERVSSHADIPIWQRPAILAAVIIVLTVIINLIFW